MKRQPIRLLIKVNGISYEFRQTSFGPGIYFSDAGLPNLHKGDHLYIETTFEDKTQRQDNLRLR